VDFELIVTCLVSVSRCDLVIVAVVCRASCVLKSRYNYPVFFCFQYPPGGLANISENHTIVLVEV